MHATHRSKPCGNDALHLCGRVVRDALKKATAFWKAVWRAVIEQMKAEIREQQREPGLRHVNRARWAR